MTEQSPAKPNEYLSDLIARLPGAVVSEEKINALAKVMQDNTQRVIQSVSPHEKNRPRATANADSRLSHRRIITMVMVSTRVRIAFAIIALVLMLGAAGSALKYLLSVEEAEWLPASVSVSKAHQIAYLRARNGNTIFQWESSVENGVRAAAFVPASTSNGRGALAIVGYDQYEPTHPGQFVIYRTDRNREDPQLSIRLTNEEMPSDLQSHPRLQFVAAQFSANLCRAADVFPDVPGMELIVVFQHGTFSQCSLQVRDLDGKLLYQAWHDGNMWDVYWMANSNQIVCAGVNGEVDAVQRGLGSLVQIHPKVVFSIVPKIGETKPQWINTVDHANGIMPSWYRCLIGSGAPEQPIHIKLGQPFSGYDARQYVTVVLDLSTSIGLGGIGWTLDNAGQEVPGTRHGNDMYRRALAEGLVPEMTVFQLGDLPPILNRQGVWIPGEHASSKNH